MHMNNDLGQHQNLGRRYLKSFACGTAHMFSCSSNHYAWLARHYNISRVTIDLLNQTIEPVEFDIKRNRMLAEYCRNSLLRSINRLKPPSSITSAMLIAEFGIQDHFPMKEPIGSASQLLQSF